MADGLGLSLAARIAVEMVPDKKVDQQDVKVEKIAAKQAGKWEANAGRI